MLTHNADLKERYKTKDAKDLFPVNFFCEFCTPAFPVSVTKYDY